jgi:hypothetical protein
MKLIKNYLSTENFLNKFNNFCFVTAISSMATFFLLLMPSFIAFIKDEHLTVIYLFLATIPLSLLSMIGCDKTLPYTKYGHKKEQSIRNTLNEQLKEKLLLIINYEKLKNNKVMLLSLNQYSLKKSILQKVKENEALLNLTVQELQQRMYSLTEEKIDFYQTQQQKLNLSLKQTNNIFDVKKALDMSL